MRPQDEIDADNALSDESVPCSRCGVTCHPDELERMDWNAEDWCVDCVELHRYQTRAREDEEPNEDHLQAARVRR